MEKLLVLLLVASAVAGTPSARHFPPSALGFSERPYYGEWYATEEARCLTIGGEDVGSPCVFPFTFDGQTYDFCTVVGPKDDLPWCSTRVDLDGNHIRGLGYWGHCRDDCVNESAVLAGSAHPEDCFEKDVDYFGNDINLSTARTTDRRNSAVECQNLCREIEGCLYFSWTRTLQECFLKSAGGPGKDYVYAGSTSGPKTCAATTTTTPIIAATSPRTISPRPRPTITTITTTTTAPGRDPAVCQIIDCSTSMAPGFCPIKCSPDPEICEIVDCSRHQSETFCPRKCSGDKDVVVLTTVTPTYATNVWPQGSSWRPPTYAPIDWPEGNGNDDWLY